MRDFRNYDCIDAACNCPYEHSVNEFCMKCGHQQSDGGHDGDI